MSPEMQDAERMRAQAPAAAVSAVVEGFEFGVATYMSVPLFAQLPNSGAANSRPGDAFVDRFVDRLRRHLQLVLHVQRAGGDEGVDARAPRFLQGRPGPVDVLARRPCKTANGRVLDQPGDLANMTSFAAASKARSLPGRRCRPVRRGR